MRTKQERIESLVLELMDVAKTAHPQYNHNEQLAWALGVLAETVLEKNYMDNIVFAKLNHKLNTIRGDHKYKDITK